MDINFNNVGTPPALTPEEILELFNKDKHVKATPPEVRYVIHFEDKLPQISQRSYASAEQATRYRNQRINILLARGEKVKSKVTR